MRHARLGSGVEDGVVRKGTLGVTLVSFCWYLFEAVEPPVTVEPNLSAS
jgi:hypothetical protein